MNPQLHRSGTATIVYDADQLQQPPGIELFNPQWWRDQGRVTGQAEGRGSALMLDTPYGDAVLRRYLRGGWASRISHSRYFFTGLERSRPVAEFCILAALTDMGLPVPQPLAALCDRAGLTYSGSLLMHRIPATTALADLLNQMPPEDPRWSLTGRCIRRFHCSGVIHADLNTRNILLSEGDEVFLIDFDRARIRNASNRAFESNLRRLHRSLVKVWPADLRYSLKACWDHLIAGYNAAAEQTGAE